MGRTGGPGKPMSLQASRCPGPLLSRDSTVEQGWGPREADVSAGESRVPVFLLVSSERCSPRGGAGQMLPSSPSCPGAGWVAACSQGLLLWIQIKQFLKLSGVSRVSKRVPGPAGRPVLPELELDLWSG